MKTLLTTILILFTMILIGQNSKYLGSRIPLKDSTGNTITIPEFDESYWEVPDIPRSRGVVRDTEEFILDLLIEYETDCFNDSAVSYYYTLCDMGCWDVPCNKGDTLWHGGLCPEHWHHEEPTFKGFIKWLKLK